MKKAMLLLLAVVLLGTAGCRRRMDPNAPQVEYETVFQPVPVPIEGQGQKVPDRAGIPGEDTKTELDPDAPPVEETVAAQGGETVPDAPSAPPKGETITVTLDAMGGSCPVSSVTVSAGGVYGVLPVPRNPGHTFQGWFRQPDGGEPVNAVSVVLERLDHTLYAHWTTKTEYTLTFDPNGGRVSPYSAQKQIYSGSVYGELPTPIREGYAFLGWYTQPEEGAQLLPTDLVAVIDDQTVFAHWQYDPMAYWSFVLENTNQRIFSCQEVFAYLEQKADGVSMVNCPLISDAGAANIARNTRDDSVTDRWVREKNPSVIIKLTDNMGAAEATRTAVENRFPGTRVYVFPEAAVEGTEAEQLFYKLRLAAICYPQYYEELDFGKIADELGVAG